MLLTAKEILARDDLPVELVEVPEWGGEVRVRALTALEREQWVEKYAGDRAKEGLFAASLLAASCVDEKGGRLFTESDIESLARKSAKAVLKVYEVAARLNGIGERGREEAEKNSTGQGDGKPAA